MVRVLDPAERYYWFVEHMAPMNAITIAELDCEINPDDLAVAFGKVQAAHRLLSVGIARLDGDLVFVSGRDEIPLTVRPIRRDELAWVVDAEMDSAFDLEKAPLARATYLPLVDGPGSVIVIATHHTISDALASIGFVREVVRAVAGQEPGPVDSEVPIAVHDRFPPELAAPRAAVDVLRAIRDERKGVEIDEFPFHDRHCSTRQSRFHQLAIREPAISELATHAKAAGGTVNGVIGAAVLESVAALYDDEADRVITLSSPAELRTRAHPPIDRHYFGLIMGMLSSPYRVSPSGNPDLPRQISEQIRREVQRGEAHLFYRFARANAYSVDAKGLAAFREWYENSTPDSVTLSNMGRIDDTGDPDYLRSVTAVLGASSNQVAFASVSTYRGELLININTDEGKLAPDPRDALIRGVAQRLGAVETTRRGAG